MNLILTLNPEGRVQQARPAPGLEGLGGAAPHPIKTALFDLLFARVTREQAKLQISGVLFVALERGEDLAEMVVPAAAVPILQSVVDAPYVDGKQREACDHLAELILTALGE